MAKGEITISEECRHSAMEWMEREEVSLLLQSICAARTDEAKLAAVIGALLP